MNSLLTSDLAKSIAASAVRHIATAAGAYLVSDGVINSSMANDLLGSSLCIFAVVWSIIQKRATVPAAPATKEPPHV